MDKMIVDFRSDTVTKPTEEMLEAMFHAKVGDDVYEEDFSVNELQNYAAKLFGKEAALFCASGTQTNQIAINVHTKPGGEVICHEESHVYKYEGGGIAKNSGASVRLLQGNRGRLFAKDVEQAIQPYDVHFPITQLISIEDTANRGGGAVYDFSEVQKIHLLAQTYNIPLHLDGARLFNALEVSKISPSDYAKSVDSISICLSKGLGAPVGSLLLGSADFIKQARRVRKVMGGGMRQAGFLAAAGLFALKNNVVRLAVDREQAQLLEKAFQGKSWVKETFPVETNILVVVLNDVDIRDLYIQKFAEKGVKVSAFGPGMIRLVTQLDITPSMINYTLDILATW